MTEERKNLVHAWIEENEAHHRYVLSRVYPSWMGMAAAFYIMALVFPAYAPTLLGFASVAVAILALRIYGGRIRLEAEARVLRLIMDIAKEEMRKAELEEKQ